MPLHKAVYAVCKRWKKMAGYYQDETGKTVKASNYDEAAKKLYQPAYYVGWK